jgi:hypothetical protein
MEQNLEEFKINCVQLLISIGSSAVGGVKVTLVGVSNMDCLYPHLPPGLTA